MQASHPLAVVGVDALEEQLECRLDRPGFQAEQPVALVGPQVRAGRHVEFPAAEATDALRKRELAGETVVLRKGFEPFGDVPADPDAPHDVAARVAQRLDVRREVATEELIVIGRRLPTDCGAMGADDRMLGIVRPAKLRDCQPDDPIRHLAEVRQSRTDRRRTAQLGIGRPDHPRELAQQQL